MATESYLLIEATVLVEGVDASYMTRLYGMRLRLTPFLSYLLQLSQNKLKPREQ
jgi:hypothetical protein